jgi:hypothetical protein
MFKANITAKEIYEEIYKHYKPVWCAEDNTYYYPITPDRLDNAILAIEQRKNIGAAPNKTIRKEFDLWILINEENERDGCSLKPAPWEGPGEYRHVKFTDGSDGLRKVKAD